MKRRVIQIAGSTQLVSLPRKWALKHGVKKGDEIDVLEEGDKIIISTQTESKLGKATLKIDNHKKFLRRTIDTLYRLGYDEVEIEFSDKETFEKVQGVIDELLGFEIVQHTSNSCVLKNIASGEEMEFDNILRRIFLMLIEMAKNGLDAIEAKDYKLLEKYAKFDSTINRFTNFCERLLNKKGYKDYKKTNFIYFNVCALEQISDEFQEIFVYLAEKKPSKSIKEFSLIYKELTEILVYFYEHVFYENTINNLVTLKEMQTNLYKHIQHNIEEKKCEYPLAAHNILSISDLIRHISIRLV